METNCSLYTAKSVSTFLIKHKGEATLLLILLTTPPQNMFCPAGLVTMSVIPSKTVL